MYTEEGFGDDGDKVMRQGGEGFLKEGFERGKP